MTSSIDFSGDFALFVHSGRRVCNIGVLVLIIAEDVGDVDKRKPRYLLVLSGC
jgi:hypothetical protein